MDAATLNSISVEVKGNIWFPKSAVETTESGQYRAAEWAINAKCHDNIYNGHTMYFVNCDCPIYL